MAEGMPGNATKNTDNDIGANVFSLGVVSFLTDVSSEMIFPILPIFVTTMLGAGKEVLGLIEGIADSIASLVEIFSGYFSDRSGKRKEFVVFGYGLSSIMKVGIALSATWWQVLITRGLERIGKGIRTSPRDAIIAASSAKEVRGKAFGLHRAMDTAGAIVGPLVAYSLLSWVGISESGYRNVFLLALIPATLAVAIILLFVKEPEKTKVFEEKPSFWVSLNQMPADYKTFLKISLLFSLSYFSFAFFIIRAADIGIKPGDVILLYIFYNIIYALVSVPIGSLSDKIGRKPVIAAAFALYALICVGFAFATEWWHAVVFFALYGIFVSADESVNKAYIGDLTSEEKRAMAFGAYGTAVGAAYLPASVILGGIWAAFGATAAFMLSAAIAMISSLILFFYKPDLSLPGKCGLLCRYG